MEKNVKSSTINYGLYLGVTLIAITAILYAVKLELLVNFWLMLVILPILIIAFGVVSTAKAKGLLGGFISFKNAFATYFITVLIGIVASTIVSYIIFNFIDPEAAVQLKELSIEKAITFMERMGAPVETIAESVKEMENQDSMSIGTQLKQLAQSIVFFSVIGLIVALIMKKNDPDKA